MREFDEASTESKRYAEETPFEESPGLRCLRDSLDDNYTCTGRMNHEGPHVAHVKRGAASVAVWHSCLPGRHKQPEV